MLPRKLSDVGTAAQNRRSSFLTQIGWIGVCKLRGGETYAAIVGEEGPAWIVWADQEGLSCVKEVPYPLPTAKFLFLTDNGHDL